MFAAISWFCFGEQQVTSDVVLLMIASLDAADMLSAQTRKDQINHSLHDSAGGRERGQDCLLSTLTFPAESKQRT